MLDATGAPVCVLLPFFFFFVFYASLFIDQASVKALGFKTGIQAYIRAIPYCFYPILTIAIVFLFALGVMPKLGTMKKAYQRVAETGKVYSDASRKYNHDDRKGYEEDGNIWNFVIPMGVLVAIAIATSNLLLAVVVSLIICFVLYVPQKVVALDDFFNLIVRGFADMLPILILLVVAFVLQKVTEGMGMTDFIISVAGCGTYLYYRFSLGHERSSCTDRISAWCSHQRKPDPHYGSDHFRWCIRKPRLLLYRRDTSFFPECRYRQYGACAVTASICNHCECTFRCGISDLWFCDVGGMAYGKIYSEK